MKKYLPLIVCLLLTGTSCKELSDTSRKDKTDIGKEKDAIKAVIEEEKNAFFSQDYSRMADTWVRGPSSAKVFLDSTGHTTQDGWDEISKGDQEGVKDNSWDRKQTTLTFSNYQIHVMNHSAWVLLDAHWEGGLSLNQTRICVLTKIDGKWRFTLMAMQRITP
jgi:hypothetical protein